jgi:hypothetical protein
MTKSRDLANAATALNAVTAAELGYVDGVTSAIQTQLDAKLASSTAATTYVPNSLADAKGDLLTATADNTPARLAVGSNGDTIVADSSTSTGLRYTENYAAGKNKILNSDYSIWQRGTTFANPSTAAYTADRWQVEHDGTGATRTISQQTFTPGAAPVAGYEGQYFYRYTVSVAGTGNTYQQFQYNQEDVRTFAGQTVTVSFWAKADASRLVTLLYRTDYGSGGSAPNQFSVGTATLTTSWVRYTITYAVPSVSGLTIGANSHGRWIWRVPAGTTQTIDIWGVQIEESPVATAFQTATGTIQGELAACQRYYWREYGAANSPTIPVSYTANSATIGGNNPVTMRVAPSVTADYQNANYGSTWGLSQPTRSSCTKTGSVSNNYFSTPNTWSICFDGGTFSPTPTAFQGSASSYIQASAEL